MSHIHMFFNFIRANCKRLLHYLPSMFVSLLLLLLPTGTAGFYLSDIYIRKMYFLRFPSDTICHRTTTWT